MHLSRDSLDSFQNQTMDTDQMIQFLEHIDQCDFCLEQFMEQETVPTPSCLKEQILTKAASPEVKTARAFSSASRKMQLLYCALRTATGVVAALFLLFCVNQIDFSSFQVPGQAQIKVESVQAPEPYEARNQNLYRFSRELGMQISHHSRKFTDYLQDFSNKIINGGN